LDWGIYRRYHFVLRFGFVLDHCALFDTFVSLPSHPYPWLSDWIGSVCTDDGTFCLVVLLRGTQKYNFNWACGLHQLRSLGDGTVLGLLRNVFRSYYLIRTCSGRSNFRSYYLIRTCSAPAPEKNPELLIAPAQTRDFLGLLGGTPAFFDLGVQNWSALTNFPKQLIALHPFFLLRFFDPRGPSPAPGKYSGAWWYARRPSSASHPEHPRPEDAPQWNQLWSGRLKIILADSLFSEI
jgi:hypothetical protein